MVTGRRMDTGISASGLDLGEAVLLDARVELRAGEAEQLRRARLVVPRLRERLDDEGALQRAHADAAARQRGSGRRLRRRRLARGAHRQMLAADVPAVAQEY